MIKQKDTNIRISHADYKLLSELAKKEGRKIKMMFSIVINLFVNKGL